MPREWHYCSWDNDSVCQCACLWGGELTDQGGSWFDAQSAQPAMCVIRDTMRWGEAAIHKKHKRKAHSVSHQSISLHPDLAVDRRHNKGNGVASNILLIGHGVLQSKQGEQSTQTKPSCQQSARAAFICVQDLARGWYLGTGVRARATTNRVGLTERWAMLFWNELIGASHFPWV